MRQNNYIQVHCLWSKYRHCHQVMHLLYQACMFCTLNPRWWLQRGYSRWWLQRGYPRWWLQRGYSRWWLQRGYPRWWLQRGYPRWWLQQGFPHFMQLSSVMCVWQTIMESSTCHLHMRQPRSSAHEAAPGLASCILAIFVQFTWEVVPTHKLCDTWRQDGNNLLQYTHPYTHPCTVECLHPRKDILLTVYIYIR